MTTTTVPTEPTEAMENWLSRWLVVFANRVQYVNLATRSFKLRDTIAEMLADMPAAPDPLPQGDLREVWLDFNLNHRVRVKLNERGLTELRRQHGVLRHRAPSIGDFKDPKADADGWSTWQLWDLMSTLGALCILGPIPPFDTGIQFENVQPLPEAPSVGGEDV